MKQFVAKFFFALLLSIGFSFFSTTATHAQETQNFSLGFTARPGSESGTVELHWTDVDIVDNYNLVYGHSSRNYQYGATNIGKTNHFTVRGLQPGATYYFSLSPILKSNGLAFVSEVHAVAAGTKALTQSPTIDKVQASNGDNPTMTIKTTSSRSSHSTLTVHSRDSFQARVHGPSDDKYRVRAERGPSPGEVSLHWDNPDGARDFHVVYGSSQVHEHAALHVGRDSNRFVISQLNPGTTYYFSIIGLDDDEEPHWGYSLPVAQIASS